MTIKILIEILLAVITFFACSQLWQLLKRDRFVGKLMSDEPQLERIVLREALEAPSPRIAPYAEKHESGYWTSIAALFAADRDSKRILKIVLFVLTAAVLVGSYFLVGVYFFINCVLFLALGLLPLSPEAKFNAVEHIMACALILHRWILDNPTECDQWVQRVPPLQPLYNAVRSAQNGSRLG